MKKILLSLVLVALSLAGHAQLYISANVGGGIHNSTTTTSTRISIVKDSSFTQTVTAPKTTSFTGGLKVGYKFLDRYEVGVSGSYSIYNQTGMALDGGQMPLYDDSRAYLYTMTGSQDEKTTSFTIAPYIRVDVIKAGDVSLFIEASGFYTKTLDPEVTAHTILYAGTSAPKSADTLFTPDLNSTSYGARLTPGLSWQLNKYCGVDLYFDFLSFTYCVTNTHQTSYGYTYDFSGTGISKVRTTDTYVTETSDTYIGGALTGSPLLSDCNWVRVGFNFTF